MRSPSALIRMSPLKASLLRSPRIFLAVCLLVSSARAQSPAKQSALSSLDQLSGAIQNLASRVSPSVVRIRVTRYGRAEEGGRTDLVVSQEEAVGSGVIIDPDGYILTNAHVVSGARSIKVNLTPRGEQSAERVIAQSYAPAVDATLTGVFKEGDLALIKVDATGLPALPLADYAKLRQGEVVFAFGSPQGLQNSVSMGVVSSIARQVDPDSPFLFIQTDTAINPGNSGGPLVNTAGEVVGLNTFILSQSGGNEGVGFAIPSTLIQWVYPQLRKRGHVHRSMIGLGFQAITPTLAAALKLSRSSGVLISDVRPGGPADKAGIKLNDILAAINGRQVDAAPALMEFFYHQASGQAVNIRVMRGTQEMSFDVVPVAEPHQADRLEEFADAAEALIPSLGILGVTVDKRITAIAGELRLPAGVIVAARSPNPSGLDTGLQVSDVIYAVNGDFVVDIATLKSAISRLQPGDPVALLIERNSQLQYVAFEIP
jgi:serine protease Do